MTEKYNPSVEEIKILKHSLGVKTTIKNAYRNYFCADPGHADIMYNVYSLVL